MTRSQTRARIYEARLLAGRKGRRDLVAECNEHLAWIDGAAPYHTGAAMLLCEHIATAASMAKVRETRAAWLASHEAREMPGLEAFNHRLAFGKAA